MLRDRIQAVIFAYESGITQPGGTGIAVSGKELVRRLIEEGVNRREVAVLDEIADGEFAEAARQWASPFRGAFPDFTMEIVNLVEEGDTVVAHFHCSGTHSGEWLGVPATGRRFENVDEIYVFRVENGKLVAAYGVEDNLSRLRQLGIGFTTT